MDIIAETVAFRWPTKIEIMSGFANGMAQFVLNTHGCEKFLFIATTKNSTSILIDVARIAA